MKNDVVMEVNGSRAVVLSGAGVFSVVRNRNYTVGQRLEGRSALGARRVRMFAAAAAAAVLLVAGGAYAYCAPASRVTMDVNPSIELSLNIFDRIVGATALNEDAASVLDRLRLLNATLPSAVESIVAELADQGYLAGGAEADIMVTAASADRARSQDVLQDAVESVKRKTAELEIQASVLGECIGEEVRNRAREYGVSPGKLRLAEQYALSTGDPSGVDLRNWLDKPVREIVAATRANGGVPVDSANGYRFGDGSGNGYGAATPTPGSTGNGYLGGDKSGNGYNGGQQSGNGGNNTPAPGATPSPGASPTGSGNGYQYQNQNQNGSTSSSGAAESPAPGATPAPSASPACSSAGAGPSCSPDPTGDANQNRNGPNK